MLVHVLRIVIICYTVLIGTDKKFECILSSNFCKNKSVTKKGLYVYMVNISHLCIKNWYNKFQIFYSGMSKV